MLCISSYTVERSADGNHCFIPKPQMCQKAHLTYTQVGDCLYPNLALGNPPDTEPLNRYDMMRKAFIKEHMRISHTIMLAQETLYPHCRAVQQQAVTRIIELIEQLQRVDLVPCKNQDGQAWANHMTTFRATAGQIALS